MRKQYHSRPSDQGLRVWDIHRLVELSKDFPVVDIPLATIQELNEAYWYENGGKPTCKSIAEHMLLIQEVNPAFPVILFSDGRVVDGMHRVCRAWMNGEETIKAVRFNLDPEPDYVGVALDDLPY